MIYLWMFDSFFCLDLLCFQCFLQHSLLTIVFPQWLLNTQQTDYEFKYRNLSTQIQSIRQKEWGDPDQQSQTFGNLT